MPRIAKLSDVTWSSIAEVNDISSSSIAKISGQDAPSSYLLDTYTGSSAAYSVRKLSSGYTGACMRVREGSGNTETDIGFDSNGYLDTAAIATHCGSAIGYVTKWYDQSTSGGTGSGNDAVQSTSTQQPRIYDGSSVYTDNGVAAVRVPNVANGGIGLDLESNVRTTLGPSSVFVVYNVDAQTSSFQRVFTFYRTQGMVIATTTATNYQDIAVGDGSGTAASQAYVRFNDSTIAAQKVRTFMYDGTSTTAGGKAAIEFRINGVEDTTPIDGNAGFYVPASGENSLMYRVQNNTQGMTGYMQECIIYDTEQSSNRANIESDITTYFSIT